MAILRRTVQYPLPTKRRNQGFTLEEIERKPDDTIFELYFKGAHTGRRFSKLWLTEQGIDNACQQFIEELNTAIASSKEA